MGELAKEILPVNIEDELKNSYLDYAMSVIVGRALPDVRDGLKPVHRRVLYAMNVLGNDFNKPYKKSARVVGDVIGKYHPHGDTAVYDTIVRMAQPFSLRYMLVDGQGNFGSVDGDAPAAMRYTEIRMSKIAHDLMADLDKETVDFVPNYDGTESEPSVMPTRIPNLLVNGSSGIAVGMATNIPPHNLNEIVDACLAIVDNPELSFEQLLEIVPGPDFPTAAIINGRAGILDAYRTGRGKIYIRARHHIETDEKSGKDSIIIDELPYQVNKARLIEKIAELVKDKVVEGITALRDESDKDGMRMVIELRRGEIAEVTLNKLFTHTQLQTVFGINMVALVDGQPRTLALRECLDAFIRHRREVVTRRTVYELRKAREKAHILEGLAVALANIDPIIALIKASGSPAEAKEQLLSRSWSSGTVLQMLERAGAIDSRPEDLEEQFGLRDGQYYLSPAQAQAILDLRLNKLTGLEHEKILAEYQELLKLIGELLFILASPERLMEVIREELVKVKDEYGDKRRTEIQASQDDISLEDLIAEENVVVTLSHKGYAKYQPLTEYQAQRRGGRGKAAAKVKDEDYVDQLLIASTHDTLMLFSSRGRVYWLKAYQLPLGSRTAAGRPIVNMLPLEENERITAILPIREYEEGKFILMATREGTVKKTELTQYARQRSTGLIAVALDEGDELISVAVTDGTKDVMLFTDGGKVNRFHEEQVRTTGRDTRGVRGITLNDEQKLISMIIPEDNCAILTATENGYGKRTAVEEYPGHNRGGQGVISIQTTDRNGKVVGAIVVHEGEQIMLISDQGTLVRTRVDEVSVLSRNTQGVTLIRLAEDEHLAGIQRIMDLGDEEDDAGDESENGESGEEAAAGNESPTQE
ncbi:MAG: DNA gyrase subunit A [Gammaproteobacteria bacterium]|nr:DNA gyrase subunit A [Gammaproteobacteria bacterium]